MKEFESEIAKLQDQISEIQASKDTLMKEHQLQLKKVGTQLEEEQKKVSTLTIKIEDLKGDQEALDSGRAEEVEELRSEIRRLSQEISSKDRQIMEYVQIIENFESKSQEKVQEIAQLKSEIKHAKKVTQKNTEVMDQLQQELDEKKIECNSLISSSYHVEVELKTIKDEKEILEKQLKNLSDANSSNQTELQQLLKAAQNESLALQAKLQQCQNSHQDLEKQSGKHKSYIEQLEHQLGQQEKNISEKEKRFDALQEEILATKTALEQAEKLNSNLQAKIDDFESQTEAFELKIRELTLTQSSNRAELANKSIDLENMTISLSQEKKAFSELQESLRTAENSLNSLTLENAKLLELTQTKESQLKAHLEKIRILEVELQE